MKETDRAGVNPCATRPGSAAETGQAGQDASPAPTYRRSDCYGCAAITSSKNEESGPAEGTRALSCVTCQGCCAPLSYRRRAHRLPTAVVLLEIVLPCRVTSLHIRG